MFIVTTAIRSSGGRRHAAASAISQRIKARKPMRCWVTGIDPIEPREVLHPEGHDDQRDGTQTGDEAGHDARYRVRHGSSFCP